MSWINSNATYKQNSKNDLSFYHGFSKTPVEPTSTGTAATTLANASTKGGHTVIGTEVWAEEIPWFGLVASRAAAVTRLSGLTKLNDLVKVDGEGGKVYKYIGADDAVFTEAEWSSFWQEVTLTNGMTLNNRHNQPVLRYYLSQPMQTLTTTNNASIDSKGYATRLFVNESDHTGQTSGGSVISQFAAGTDNIKNGIPSVELNPKLYYNTTEKIAGTHYYDYNVSGTILWNENVASKGVKISCFRYIGKTVTGQLATVDTTVKSHSLDIADIKLALGMNPNPDSPTTSVTARVETVEDVVRVLLGLGDSDAITATESISTTANAAASNAVSTGLAAGGSIAAAIETAKQEAISSAEVTITAGTGISIEGEGTGTTFEISVDETVATAQSVTDLTARVEANEGAITALTTGDSSVAKQIETALTTAKDYTNTEVGKVTDRLTGEGDIAQAIAAADSKGQQGITDAATAKAAADAAQSTANAAKTTADTAVQTVTGDTYVKATKTGTSVTLETQISALDTALAAEGTTLANAIAAAKSAGEEAGATALAAAQAAQGTADQAVAAAATAQGDATQALADAAEALAEAQKKVATVTITDATGTITPTGTDATAPTFTVTAGTIEEAKLVTGSTVKAHVAAEIAKVNGAAETLAGRVTTAEGKIKTLEETTVPAIQQSITDLKAVSLAKSSADGLVKVSTTGTVGTGIESISVEVSDTVAKTTDTLSATSTGSNNVEVVLGGTIAEPTLIVTGTDIASAQELATLTQTVNTHIAEAAGLYLSVEKVDTLPEGDNRKTNKIYLLPLDTEAGREQNIHTEYIWTGTSWEIIGTTAIDISSLEKAADDAQKAADAAQADVDALETTVAELTTTVGENKTAAETGISEAKAAAKDAQDAADKAQSEVDELEQVVSMLSQTHASDKTTLEASIKAVSDKVGTDSVETQITSAIDAIGTGVAQSEAGISITQTKGVVELSVTPGSVAENNASVVTGGAVYAAIKAVSDLVGTTAVATQISDAIAALDSEASGNGITVTLADGKVTTVSAAAGAVAEDDTNVVTGGVVYTAVEGVKTIAEAKISAVQNDSTHFGSPLVATSGTTVTVSPAKEWSVGETKPANTITSVINGKMSDGSTIDDANLTDGTSMFANSQIQTYVGSLSKLTNGTSMFANSSLTEFCADLGSLQDGTSMFAGCTLSEESIVFIVDSLPAYTTGTHMINLGTTVPAELKAEAEGKGWTVA